jgi:hypothetical protein
MLALLVITTPSHLMQVVVVRGINPTGNRIIARHIYTHLPPPAPRANQLRQLEASAAAAPGLQLSMVAAAGPFCLLEDLSYAPLASLLQQLAAAPPQVLLLLGPFVDVENPAVAGGMMDVTFQQLFQQQVGAGLNHPQKVPGSMFQCSHVAMALGTDHMSQHASQGVHGTSACWMLNQALATNSVTYDLQSGSAPSRNHVLQRRPVLGHNMLHQRFVMWSRVLMPVPAGGGAVERLAAGAAAAVSGGAGALRA